MRFYTNVLQFGNKILVRGINDGKSVQDKIHFSPTLFVKSQKQTEYKSIFGQNLESIEFEDINEAKDFVKRYKDVEGFPIFGNTNFAYQYITKTFPKNIDFDMTQLKIYSIDIETSAEFGFPDTNDPLEEVLLISIQDYNSKNITTFGTKYFEVSKENHTYIRCDDEYDLLKKFIGVWSDNYPHIVTGWNIEFFDIPYLANRIKKVLGEDSLKQLSPWGIVNQKEISRFKKIEIVFDLMGVSILDYLDLYKKFTYNAQESYRLDHIAKVELGKEKLDYSEYESFRMFYKNNWQKFVEYNVVDTEIVDKLEDKMKLIELILTMAYDAKCNYVDIFSAVRTWDCILFNQLWKKNIVVHQRDENRKGRQIEGAFVQEPVPGKYDWVVSFDATSLYPSIIMQYNMSPETIIPNGADVTVNTLINKEHSLDVLKKDKLCMAANGYKFKTDKQGIFPEIVQKLFDDRQKYKKLMIAAQKEMQLIEEEIRRRS